MSHGTVRIELLITAKSTWRMRAPPTRSVAAITLGCPSTSPHFPPLPGQPVSRPARPPRGGRPCAPLPPPACPLEQRPLARLTAARTPHGRPRAQRPPLARPAADAVSHTPRYRLRAPQSAARPAAALAPRSSATCSARPPRRTLRGWLPPMPNLPASPTAPPLPSAPPSASLPCACGRAFGTRRGRPGRGCGGGGGPAGCPRPERCLGTENGSVRRHARAVTRRGLRVPRWFRAVPLGRLRV